MRHVLQRSLILGMLALALVAGSPMTALAGFGQVLMGVNGMI